MRYRPLLPAWWPMAIILIVLYLTITGCASSSTEPSPSITRPGCIEAPAETRVLSYFDSLLHRGISGTSFLPADSVLCDSLQSLLWALPDMHDVDPYEIHHRQAARHLLAKAYIAAGCWHKADVQATLLISYSDLALITNNKFTDSGQTDATAMNPVWNLFDSQNMILPANSERIALIHSHEWPELNVSAKENIRFMNLRQVSGVTDNSDIRYKLGSDTDPLHYKHHGDSSDDSMYLFRLAETYLLRAKARFMSGHIYEAANDVNLVRIRANCSIMIRDVTLRDIEEERTRELADEPTLLIF